MRIRFRLVKILTIALTALAALLIIGNILIPRYIRNKLDLKLKRSGLTFTDLSINLFSRSMTVTGIEWTNSGDSITSYPHHLNIQSVYAGGINVIALFRNKRIECQRLTISGGNISINRLLIEDLKQEEVAASGRNDSAYSLKISELLLSNIQIKIMSDSTEQSTASVSLKTSHFEVPSIGNLADPLSYKIGSVQTDILNFKTNTPKSLYKFRVSKISVDSESKQITVDSVSIIPKYSKYTFSRKLGRQKDRLVLLVPKISIEGIGFGNIKDSLFTASRINIVNANLLIYKDKRLPFIRNHNVPLPIAQMRKFKFGFAVDTINIVDARIVYEEFPAEGYHPGQIVFSKLNAKLDHINNRDLYPGYRHATLTTRARVMGTGIIDATFTLPYEKSQIYTAKGSIRNLTLDRLNPIIENLAFISFENGRLNTLDFSFNYDDFKSNGSILVNYENLKLKSLTREREPDNNEFKTWVLNLFLKNDKDQSVSKEKRTGKIEYERERRKAIFVVWVKSLMSGLKSSLVDSPEEKGLDPSQKSGKELRKEKRDSIREERKARKKERKAG